MITIIFLVIYKKNFIEKNIIRNIFIATQILIYNTRYKSNFNTILNINNNYTKQLSYCLLLTSLSRALNSIMQLSSQVVSLVKLDFIEKNRKMKYEVM